MARKPIKLTPEELGQTASQRVKKTLGSGTRTATSFIKDIIPQKAKDTVRSGLEKGRTTGNKILNKVYTPEAQARSENVRRMAESVGQKPGNTVANQAQLEAQKRIAQGEKVLKDTAEATKRATSTARQNIGTASSRANARVAADQNRVGPNERPGARTGTTRINQPATKLPPSSTSSAVNDTTKGFRAKLGRVARSPGGRLGLGGLAAEGVNQFVTAPIHEAYAKSQYGKDVTGRNIDQSDTEGRGLIQKTMDFFTGNDTGFRGERSPYAAESGGFSRENVGLRPDPNDIVDPEQEQDPAAQIEQTTASTTPEDAVPAETGGKRRTLREALAGFKRSDNPLADAMKLNARLGLADSHNRSLRKTQEFDETKRQNDFTNAMDLHSAQMDELAAAGDISKDEADARKAENQVTKDGYDRIDNSNMSDSAKEEAKKDFTFQQARENPDPESFAVQSTYADIMREIAGEEDSPVGKIIAGIVPDFFGGAGGFSGITDSFDGPAPLMDANTIGHFSIDESGNLTADKGDGVQSFVADLDDLNPRSAQFLQAVIGRRGLGQ